MTTYLSRTPAAALLLALGAALLAGCADDGNAAGKDPATDPAATPTATAATDGATTGANELVIRPGSIGAARVGMTREQWTATGLFAEGAVLCEGELIHWKSDPQARELFVLTDEDATITQLFVSAPGPRTDRGDIQVGSTYGDLKRAHADLTKPVADGFGQASVRPAGEDGGATAIGFLLDAPPDELDDDTEIARIAVTGGERPSFQYDC